MDNCGRKSTKCYYITIGFLKYFINNWLLIIVDFCYGNLYVLELQSVPRVVTDFFGLY